MKVHKQNAAWIAFTFVLLAALTGCSEKPDFWRGRIEVVKGVRSMISDAPVLHPPDSLVQIAWTEDLVIQSDADSNHAFQSVYGVTTDSKGHIYVVDAEGARIFKYGEDGTFLTSLGSRGVGPTQFMTPTDIDVDKDDNLYVVDYKLNRVSKFTPQLEFADVFETRVIRPRRIRVDTDGNVLVFALTQHDLIYKFSPDGQILGSFYDPTEDLRIMGKLDQFIAYSDAAMEVSNDGYVYVSSRHPYRIRKFDRATGLALEFSRVTPFEMTPFDDWPGHEIPPPVGISGEIAVLPDGRVMNVIQYQTFEKVDTSVPLWKRDLKIHSMDRWVDVFMTDGKWQMTSRITVPGFPAHVDRQGRVYFIETNPYRVVRYQVVFPETG